MALDEALASADDPAPTLRLYGWDPWTLSLGWFQRVEEGDLAPWRARGFDVTRRPTGGGAIFHADEVTYSLVLPAGDRRIPLRTADSYLWLHGAVREALAAVGIAADSRGEAPEGEPDPFFCFSRTAAFDLVAGGRKIVGSAQRRTRTAFLQHGSIPLSPNGTAPGSASVAEARGSPADGSRLEEALVAAFGKVLDADPVPSAPTPEEEALAVRLEQEKYGNPSWVLRPWKGPGRRSGPVPPPPPPIHLLRASVEKDRLLVRGASGGARPDLPHGDLRAVDAEALLRRETRALSPERDPWDSTFRRSAFEGAQGPAGPEGLPPVSRETGEETVLLTLTYRGAGTVVLDARRFDFRDLGPRRTGDPVRDAVAFLRDLLSRAPAAAPGPGARALLEGRPLPRKS